YQIATIGSVHVARRKRSNPFAVLTFLLGLGVLAAAIVKSRMTGLADEYFSMAVTGVAVMLAALLLQLIWPGRVYVLVLRTSSGDVDAVTSRNKEFVSNLQKAVEQAFLVRARETACKRSRRHHCDIDVSGYPIGRQGCCCAPRGHDRQALERSGPSDTHLSRVVIFSSRHAALQQLPGSVRRIRLSNNERDKLVGEFVFLDFGKSLKSEIERRVCSMI